MKALDFILIGFFLFYTSLGTASIDIDEVSTLPSLYHFEDNTSDLHTYHNHEIDPLILLRALVLAIDKEQVKLAQQAIRDNWKPSYIPALIELTRFVSSRRSLRNITTLLEEKTGEKYADHFGWLTWLWDQDVLHEDWYFDLKADIYQEIDPRFERYFKGRFKQSHIRPDEIVWGGVHQDGIPPLRNPSMISALEATYLDDDDVVFGIYINNIPRAYPKRILAWHEFFTDYFGDTHIAGVYCTLCGTVIAYDMEDHILGTSGFLYRSNKLMYDNSTQSLWNTIEGKPVVGPLADHNIQLESYPVVTTTWGDWKKRHPLTTVLSLKTGHNRNYDEGEAYRAYFATDQLMFPVPRQDKRLKNKDEVFIIRTEGYKDDPTAIAIRHLKKKKWLQLEIADQPIAVVYDETGAKAYYRGSVNFNSYKNGTLIDQYGIKWSVTPNSLTNEKGEQLERLSGHNIFWFAWFNTYPDTRLIK